MTELILDFPYDGSCLICGNISCSESYDHQKVTLEEINKKLN